MGRREHFTGQFTFEPDEGRTMDIERQTELCVALVTVARPDVVALENQVPFEWVQPNGKPVMDGLFGRYPSLLKFYAYSGYQGPKFREGSKKVCRKVIFEIVKRADVGKFLVLPRQWVVERTIRWLNNCCRLAKN